MMKLDKHYAPKGKFYANYLHKRFGRLLCIGKIDDENWLYKCDCGKEITVYRHKIHWRKSCGCLEKESALKRGNAKRRYDSVTITTEYLMYKNNAQQRKWEPLPKNEWEILVKEPCFYCGGYDIRNRASMDSYLKKRGKSLNKDDIKLYEVKMNGIDRIDSLRGYTKDNIVSCCSICNRMKNSFSKDVFLEKVKLIYNNFWGK